MKVHVSDTNLWTGRSFCSGLCCFFYKIKPKFRCTLALRPAFSVASIESPCYGGLQSSISAAAECGVVPWLWLERKYSSLLLNDVGHRRVSSHDRLHLSSMPSDIHTRELVSRSVGHMATPSPVSSVFEAVQRPPAVVNYNFGDCCTPLCYLLTEASGLIH